jgi:hypothetical protein
MSAGEFAAGGAAQRNTRAHQAEFEQLPNQLLLDSCPFALT